MRYRFCPNVGPFASVRAALRPFLFFSALLDATSNAPLAPHFLLQTHNNEVTAVLVTNRVKAPFRGGLHSFLLKTFFCSLRALTPDIVQSIKKKLLLFLQKRNGELRSKALFQGTHL